MQCGRGDARVDQPENFVQLPFNILIYQIRSKAQEMGINVIIQNEERTSKCPLLDSEIIGHHETYI
jgi:putative transposase